MLGSYIKIITSLLLILLVLTGCNRDKICDYPNCQCTPDANNLVIIIGNRANDRPLTDHNLNTIRGKIYASFVCVGNGQVKARVRFFISDGNPQEFIVANRYGESANLTVAIGEKLSLIDNEIIPFIRSERFIAQSGEADLLGAIHKATQTMRNESDGRNMHMLIFDSGISTSGYLNMLEFDLYESIGDIRTMVYDRINLQMHGIDVTMMNLGNIAYPQTRYIPTTTHFRNQLTSLWEGILNNAGANIIGVYWGGMRHNTRRDGFPYVSVVRVPLHDGGASVLLLEPISALHCADTLVFNESSDNFINSESARTTIEAYLKYYDIMNRLEDDMNLRLYVIGSEARGRSSYNQDRQIEGRYSSKRADYVASILSEEFGIPYYRIVAIDAGTMELPWRDADEFAGESGSWSSSLARNNRVVAIVPTGSQAYYMVIYSEILNSGETGEDRGE